MGNEIYLKYFGYREQDVPLCEICGQPAVDIHHIKYRSQGGKDEISNLVALCRNCHGRAHFKKTPYLDSKELKRIHYSFLDYYMNVFIND